MIIDFKSPSIIDPMTGLVNRYYLEKRLTEEIERCNYYHYALSFILIDVDKFKSFNDKFGHPEGDKVLQAIGQGLKSQVNCWDIVARYAGDEFAMVLPQTASESAFRVAEQIRKNVETTSFHNYPITISIGIANYSLNLGTPSKLILGADKALDEAKNKGRNNIRIYQEPPYKK